MKKISMILASLVTASAAFAQGQEANPNRILVTNNAGVFEGFVIDYIEDISFARVDGEVLAEVTVNKVDLNSLTLTIKRTPECKSYRLAVIPQTVANQLGNDANTIRYINSLPAGDVPLLSEDFNNGTLSGIELIADSKYAVITIGIDEYGIESGIYRADFETPKPEIVGNPHVEMISLGRTQDSFTVQFTPNKDVYTYWTVAGEKGLLEEQYEQFAAMFGFSNFSQMIESWGIPCNGITEHTWSEMAPNTEYEIFVAMTDKNGNFAPYETFLTSTESKGGHGEASVDIELVSFTATDWYGETLPTQAIKFTPNDQAACYRCGVYTADVYDSETDEIKKELCSDPPVSNMAYWFQYDETVGEYQLQVSSEYVAIAAAKNIDGEWGKVTELRFTTPATCPGYNGMPAMDYGNIPSRANRVIKHKVPGLAPVMKVNTNKVTIK